MPDQIPSRDNLESQGGYSPVDPAFRAIKNPPGLPDLPEKAVLAGAPKGDSLPPIGANADLEGLRSSMSVGTGFGNSFPGKAVALIGGIITAALLVIGGIYLAVSLIKDRTDSEPQPSATPAPIANNDRPDHKYVTVKEGDNPLEALKDISLEGSSEVIEIDFQDEQGQLLTRDKFTEKSKLIIPGYISQTLAPNYYFFLINETTGIGPKAVLILQTNEKDKIGALLKRWEVYLQGDLKSFILFRESYDYIAGSNFSTFSSSGKYPGGRYLNFLKDGSVSLNYLVMRDKILIANSFDAFERGINYVISERDDL